MTFIPTSAARMMNIREVKAVSLAQLIGAREDLVLLTGGDRPHMVFMSGDYRGKGYPLTNLRDENALVIPDVEFEFVLESSFRPGYVEQPVAALKISGQNKSISVITKAPNGFEDLIDVALGSSGDLDVIPNDGEIGFERWRIVKAVEDRRLDLLQVDAFGRASY